MRIWHQLLIPKLTEDRILGQHRELAGLRGKGWGRKHSTVDYAFTHPFTYLVAYHYLLMDRMEEIGFNCNILWRDYNYRGKNCDPYQWNDLDFEQTMSIYHAAKYENKIIYPEHNDLYLKECLDNLHNKGIDL